MKSKIVKISVQTNSPLSVGRECIGDTRYGITEAAVLENYSDLKIDDMVIVFYNLYNFIKTSPISEIVEVSDDHVIFRTQTSTYRMDRV